MTKNEIAVYINSAFGISPDHPFARYPDISVFRHPGNRKWFAAQMTVPKTTVGMQEDGIIDIVNVKCDPARDLPGVSHEPEALADRRSGRACG